MFNVVGKYVSDDNKFQLDITGENPDNGTLEVNYKNELNGTFECRGHYGGTSAVAPPLSFHFYAAYRYRSGGLVSYTIDSWTGFNHGDGKMVLEGLRTIARSDHQTTFESLGNIEFHHKLALNSEHPGILRVPGGARFMIKNPAGSNVTHFNVTPGLIKRNGTLITNFSLASAETILLEAGSSVGDAKISHSDVDTLYATITVSSNGGPSSEETI